MLEDSGCKFKLNFDGGKIFDEGSKIVKKVKIQKQIASKVFNDLSKYLKEKEYLLSLLESYDYFTFRYLKAYIC